MKPIVSLIVVEDCDEKFALVDRLIREKSKEILDLRVSRADSYDTAVSKLSEGWYDFAILDILLPMSSVSKSKKTVRPSSAEYSKNLIDRIHSGEFPSTPILMGLTEFDIQLEANMPFFNNNMVHLEKFTRENTGWADKIVQNIKVLSRTLDVANFRVTNRYLSDLVILVAQPETEFAPIDRRIKWHGSTSIGHPLFPNLLIKTGLVNFGPDDARRVVLACSPDMGMVAAASLSTQLSFIFKPRVFSMLGMCCGFAKGPYRNKLCDVLITEVSACWDEGKYDANYFDTESKYKFRPTPMLGGKTLTDVAKKFVKVDGPKLAKSISRRRLHRDVMTLTKVGKQVAEIPEIKIGKILSGASVVSDSDVVDKILGRAPDATGLEMEIYGVYGALNYFNALEIDCIAIKGVADFGVEKDNDDYDPIQPVASSHSYDVLHGILSQYFADHG